MKTTKTKQPKTIKSVLPTEPPAKIKTLHLNLVPEQPVVPEAVHSKPSKPTTAEKIEAGMSIAQTLLGLLHKLNTSPGPFTPQDQVTLDKAIEVAKKL